MYPSNFVSCMLASLVVDSSSFSIFSSQIDSSFQADKVIVLGHANAPDEDLSGGEAGSGDAGGVGLSNGSGGRRSGAVILDVGTYQELESRGHDFAVLSTSAQNNAAQATSAQQSPDNVDSGSGSSSSDNSDSDVITGASSENALKEAGKDAKDCASATGSVTENASVDAPTTTTTDNTASKKKEAPTTATSSSTTTKTKAKGLVLVSEEERAVGAVGRSVYTSFLGAVRCGCCSRP